MHLPACLIILDGYGLAPDSNGNAISLAQTPVLDNLFANYPHAHLAASGKDVGLPDGQMGNSEVGHLNIGAGRIVYQELSRINKACEDGSLQKNPILSEAFARVKESEQSGSDATVHFMGLLSDGGVHSTNTHLYALIDAALSAGVKNIAVHCFMDGRDVSPTSGIRYVEDLENVIFDFSSKYPDSNVYISSLSGRYYAMDRDNRWERVSRAYEALVNAKPLTAKNPKDYVSNSYDIEITDEFIEPVSFNTRGMNPGDAVIFYNFRPDRARELTRAITDINFDGFDRDYLNDVEFICLTEYDPQIDAKVAFPKSFPENVLADVLAENGLTQYHIAETEKYAHVTFFFNGGIEDLKTGEMRKLIPSPKVATYDLQPEMSAPEVAQTLASAIRNNEADVYIVNFANCDMVGHTGIIPAVTKAVEAVDEGVQIVLDAMQEKSGVTLITADHGNADCMLSESGSPHTAHTCAPVPLVLVDNSRSEKQVKLSDGRLCDIAPTFLDLIGIEAPVEMTGRSLLATQALYAYNLLFVRK